MLNSIKLRISTPFLAVTRLPKANIFVSSILLLLTLFMCPVAMSKTLNIVTIQLAPFGFFTADKKPTGMMYEIGNLIAEEAGIAYKNKVLPYARTSNAVANGEADFVLRFTNEQLSQDAIQVVSVVAMRNIVVGLAGTEYRSLEDLHGKTVANLRDAAFDKDFSADKQIIKVDTKEYNQGLKMMFKRRVDGIVGSNVGIYYTAHTMNYSPSQLGEPLYLSTKHFWLHYSKRNTDEKIIAALKAATIKLQEQGLIQQIVEKYMGEFKLSH